MNKVKYLADKNLTDSEFKTLLALNLIIGDKEYISHTNKQIGEMIGKTSNAVAGTLFTLSKKGYVKSINHNVKRKLYILK